MGKASGLRSSTDAACSIYDPTEAAMIQRAYIPLTGLQRQQLA
jgi:hypothetical protein